MTDCIIKGAPHLGCIYVDSMLGWLARFLRIVFGLKVTYSPNIDDVELLKTQCLVVTMDEELFKNRRGPTILLKTGDHIVWISVFLSLGAKPFEKSTCPTCGGELAEVTCKEAESHVGHEIRSSQCWRCTSCGHIYWRGSHWRGIYDTVERASLIQRPCLHIG
ncbi:MAG: Mut7-C RNAse domain-containing protein [Pyrobaculum sp.]